MKKLFIVMMALALVAGFTGVSMAGIEGSKHDFSTSGWSGGEICIVCHTPHHADTTVADAPLWNHEVTTATFTPYSSLTIDASPAPDQPSAASKLCLSCHDGTVAIDSFGGSTGNNMISGDSLIGTDLSNDHPISFTYDATLASADDGLFDPTSQLSGIVGSSGTINDDMLFGGVLQCSSCHDVHNKDSNDDLLVKNNASSALCLTCHDK